MHKPDRIFLPISYGKGGKWVRNQNMINLENSLTLICFARAINVHFFTLANAQVNVGRGRIPFSQVIKCQYESPNTGQYVYASLANLVT